MLLGWIEIACFLCQVCSFSFDSLMACHMKLLVRISFEKDSQGLDDEDPLGLQLKTERG